MDILDALLAKLGLMRVSRQDDLRQHYERAKAKRYELERILTDIQKIISKRHMKPDG